MEESCSYSKLKKDRKSSRATEFTDLNISVSNLNISPPKDPYNLIYISFILGGAGFLIPYNTFIMAMDYFKSEFPRTPVVFDMSLIYIVTAFFTVLGNNLLVEACSLTNRISFGYMLSFLTLLFVAAVEVKSAILSRDVAYSVNLGSVVVVAIGCTVQQSSYYGYTSMLPARYTQAVMVGESVSGVFTSGMRVLTKYFVPDIRRGTEAFFIVSMGAIIFCYIVYHLVRKTDFIQFYLALHERAKTRIVLEPAEDAGLIDNTEFQCGMLKIQSPPANACLSFNNPVYEPTGQAPTFKVEDIVIKGRTPSITGGRMSDIKRGIQARLEITKNIYPYMVAICLVYFETLCLYPGVASEIYSCNFGSWMPIIMMSIFNGSDLLGKVLAASTMNISRKKLVRLSVLRVLLVPMMIMCAQIHPRPSMYVKDVAAFILSIVLGISNGILGSVPMIQAPSQVDDCYRELTGNLMTLLYNFGLISGSLTAYFIESIIPSYPSNYCLRSSAKYYMSEKDEGGGTTTLATTLIASTLFGVDMETSTFPYTSESSVNYTAF